MNKKGDTMKKLISQLQEVQKEICFLKSLPLYEFLLSIEKAYKKNTSLISFSFNYSSKLKKEEIFESNSFGSFNGIIDAFPTGENGIHDYSANTKGLSGISKWQNDYRFANGDLYQIYKEDFFNILKDFSHLKYRSERFDIYKKYFHGKMPNYFEIIKKWQDGILDNIDTNNSFLGLSEKIEIQNPHNLAKMIDDCNERFQRLEMMKSFLDKKLLFVEYPKIKSFKEKCIINGSLSTTRLEIRGKGIKIEKDLLDEIKKEELEEINSLNLSEKQYIFYVFELTESLLEFEIKKETLFSELPDCFFKLFKISKEEAIAFDAEIEKNIIMKSMNYDDVDELKLENKKRL